jgi:hypothetical protein
MNLLPYLDRLRSINLSPISALMDLWTEAQHTPKSSANLESVTSHSSESAAR